MAHGGYRTGAGRPAVPDALKYRQMSISVRDAERPIVKILLQMYRDGKIQLNDDDIAAAGRKKS